MGPFKTGLALLWLKENLNEIDCAQSCAVRDLYLLQCKSGLALSKVKIPLKSC